ncbi:MAG: hypothetical protein JO352_08210 [Chloroflexi bacterium]|nr:hypothetical protein [Chloroflexota bacterium]
MEAPPFSQPFMYWVGMDLDPAISAAEKDELSTFYSRVHVPEVVAANPGFVGGSRYELLDPDPRGGVHAGPRWLAVYELEDEAAATTYAQRNEAPADNRPKYSEWPASRKYLNTVWRLQWRHLATCGTARQLPDSIFMVGMNVPADTDAAGLAEFNTFYTNTHVPEVIEYGGYSRGTRFELHRAFAHPEPGSPRFCAIYEADASATEHRNERRSNRAPLSSGPPIWEKHDTIWRLVYKRL